MHDEKLNFGPWNEEETLKYLVFLDENKIVMSSKLKKKLISIFIQKIQGLRSDEHIRQNQIFPSM